MGVPLLRYRNVLNTNFNQQTRPVTLSFPLAPDFLLEVEYEKKPYGMFFVIGALPPMLSIGAALTCGRLKRWGVPSIPIPVQGCRP